MLVSSEELLAWTLVATHHPEMEPAAGLRKLTVQCKHKQSALKATFDSKSPSSSSRESMPHHASRCTSTPCLRHLSLLLATTDDTVGTEDHHLHTSSRPRRPRGPMSTAWFTPTSRDSVDSLPMSNSRSSHRSTLTMPIRFDVWRHWWQSLQAKALPPRRISREQDCKNNLNDDMIYTFGFTMDMYGLRFCFGAGWLLLFWDYGHCWI